jgi:PEP-CTERM motif
MARVIRFSIVLFLSGATAAVAEPITFENPPCAPISPGLYPSSCYLAFGLTLGSGNGVSGVNAFAIVLDPSASSPTHVARPAPGFTNLSAGFHLLPPQQGFGANGVSLNVTGSVAGQPPWQAVFFGMESELERFSGVADERITLSQAPMLIHGPAFAMLFTGGTAAQGIDDVMLGPDVAPTPEPGTLLLAALGAGAVLRRRRADLCPHPVAPPRETR